MTLMPPSAFTTASDLCVELKPVIQIIESSRTAREDICIWQGQRKAGSFQEEILAHSIFILKTSTVWPLRCRTYVREDANQRTSRGECMNSQFLIRMKRWCASVGRVACAKHADVSRGGKSIDGKSIDGKSIDGHFCGMPTGTASV